MQSFDNFVCPTCLSPGLASRTGNGNTELLECSLCGGVFPVLHGKAQLLDVRALLAIDPLLFGAWHLSQLNSLDLYRNNDPHSVALADREDVQQVMQLMDLRGRDVLDIGSGTFLEPQYFGGLGAKSVIALDPIEPEGPAKFHFVGGFAEFLPFADQSFDAITLITSLDHVLDVPASLRELLRTLRKGGEIFFWGGLTDDPSLLGKPLPMSPVVRRPFAPTSNNIAEYEKNVALLAAAKADVATRPEHYKTLLVDRFHLRHFSRASLLTFFRDAGMRCLSEDAIWYSTGWNSVLRFDRAPDSVSLAVPRDVASVRTLYNIPTDNFVTAFFVQSSTLLQLASALLAHRIFGGDFRLVVVRQENWLGRTCAKFLRKFGSRLGNPVVVTAQEDGTLGLTGVDALWAPNVSALTGLSKAQQEETRTKRWAPLYSLPLAEHGWQRGKNLYALRETMQRIRGVVASVFRRKAHAWPPVAAKSASIGWAPLLILRTLLRRFERPQRTLIQAQA